MFKKLKEFVDHRVHDPILFMMDPRSYFPACGLIICVLVLLNLFVFYRFEGKTNETTAVVAVVQEVSAHKNYTLRIEETNREFQYKLSETYTVGESVKGYYDGTHFLTEKQAKHRGIIPVLIWAVPLSIVIYIGFWFFIIAFVRTALGG